MANEEPQAKKLDDEVREIEVLVIYQDGDQVHRRIITFKNDLPALKAAIVEIFKDVITGKLATATGLSPAEVHDVTNSSQVSRALHLTVYNEKYKEFIDLQSVPENQTKVYLAVITYTEEVPKM